VHKPRRAALHASLSNECGMERPQYSFSTKGVSWFVLLVEFVLQSQLWVGYMAQGTQLHTYIEVAGSFACSG